MAERICYKIPVRASAVIDVSGVLPGQLVTIMVDPKGELAYVCVQGAPKRIILISKNLQEPPRASPE